jgi:HAD superfamily phosphoserine phosphatase-like hydrolase
VLGFLQRRPWRLPGLLRFLPTLARFALKQSDRGELKSALLKATLGGCTRAELDEWTEHFVPSLLAHGLFADALDTIAGHRREGDRLVLMSASTDLYVPCIAHKLGFAEVVCTGIRWDGDRLNGELTTPNRRGLEKARCFAALHERYPTLSTVAYGNARSDLDHLRLADRGVLVNGTHRARREAARDAIQCVQWH